MVSGVNDSAYQRRSHHWPVVGCVNDTADQWWAVSMTPLNSGQQYQWHHWPLVSSISDTADQWYAVSMTLLTSCGRCQWHRLPNMTPLNRDQTIPVRWLILKRISKQNIHSQIILPNTDHFFVSSVIDTANHQKRQFESRISLQIKIHNRNNRIYNPWIRVVWWKNQRSKISWQGSFSVRMNFIILI
jgi:hypothetical protein